MKKILLITIICLACLGIPFNANAQNEDFEEIGRRHYENAFFKAGPQKNKKLADAEFALAERAFQKAIEENPQRIEAYLHLGRTYHRQKKYTAAAGIYRSALKIAPQQKNIYLRLASALEKEGDYLGAVNALEKLRALESDDRAIRIIDDFIGKIIIKRTSGAEHKKSQFGEFP